MECHLLRYLVEFRHGRAIHKPQSHWHHSGDVGFRAENLDGDADRLPSLADLPQSLRYANITSNFEFLTVELECMHHGFEDEQERNCVCVLTGV